VPRGISKVHGHFDILESLFLNSIYQGLANSKPADPHLYWIIVDAKERSQSPCTLCLLGIFLKYFWIYQGQANSKPAVPHLY
jgi:hypothetical protein